MQLSIFEDLENLIRDVLQGWVLTNIENMLEALNEKVAMIAGELSTTPATWNAGGAGGEAGGLWTVVEAIAENVALPIAGIIFTFVIIWELITLLIAPNNLGDVDIISVLVKWLCKALVAAFFISNSLVICNCFFGIGANMVKDTKAVLKEYNSTDINTDLLTFFTENFSDSVPDEDKPSLGDLVSLGISTMLISFVIHAMGLLIQLIMYARMISIYMYCCVSPIPLSTITNRNLSNVGQGFLKSCFALAMQGVLMMICVVIYGAMINTIVDPAALMTGDTPVVATVALTKSLWSILGISVILVFTLFKSEGITKQIFGIQ